MVFISFLVSKASPPNAKVPLKSLMVFFAVAKKEPLINKLLSV